MAPGPIPIEIVKIFRGTVSVLHTCHANAMNQMALLRLEGLKRMQTTIHNPGIIIL